MNDYFNERDELVCGRCGALVSLQDFTCECEFVVDGDAREIRDNRTGNVIPFKRDELKIHKPSAS